MSDTKSFSSTGTELYSYFIYLSRYSRWLEDKNRRETWDETVSRYINFFIGRFPEFKDDLLALKEPIKSLKVMPSMRALTTAGPALERSEIAGYNCSYLPIDCIEAFDELLVILMNGCGAGFSVESQYTNKLPTVPHNLFKSNETILVEDSREGWGSAFRELMTSLYRGDIPSWNLSQLRPAGAKLKTFGGRSSGPEPLKELLEFTVNTFQKAKGRKLTSLECHDVVCKIAQIVVAGGYRRSALLGLSDLDDENIREAKSGEWWKENVQRALSNNSAVYNYKPSVETFMKEWDSLYRSHSGERGIFSREASRKQVSKNGRRDPNYEWATNPCCVTGDTLVLTKEGNLPIKNLVDKEIEAWNGKEWSKVVPYSQGVHYVCEVTLSDGTLIKCTPNHKFLVQCFSSVPIQKIEVGKLYPGDTLAGFNLPEEFDIRENSNVLEIKNIDFPEEKEEVFCFTEEKLGQGTFNGVVTGNSEIILRPNEFCNLTEVVVRNEDTLEDLKEKVRVATILGTFQSTLTNFKYLRPEWKKNCDEERLLGVSLTGVMDHPILSDWTSDQICGWLTQMKWAAIETNKEWSKKLGINQSVAITTQKPSGTISQLVNSASGIHARFAPSYIRTVRADNKDPLASMMKDLGFPYEEDITNKNVLVFSFPIKSPLGAKCVEDMTAIEQLEIWKVYQEYWCEHKSSCTIYYKDDEFLEVGAWVYKNFDSISGLSFLPYSDHTYKQAPYQPITKEQYEELEAKMPKNIDWNLLQVYETYDSTKSSHTYACSADGGCETVDLTTT